MVLNQDYGEQRQLVKLVLENNAPQIDIMGFDDNDNKISGKTSIKHSKNQSQILNFSPCTTENEIMIEVDDSFLNYKEPKIITRNTGLKGSYITQWEKFLGKREMIPTSSFVFNDMIRSKTCTDMNQDVKEFLVKSK